MAPKKKNFLAGFADALGQVAGAVGEVVSSAGELLVDADLRRKGAQYIVQEASRGINEAQRGLEASADALGRSIQQGARARFGAGARQLQSVLRNIERQVQEFQRQQQQRDLQSEIEHHHKLPVDIQIGDQVFEDMPQEMRSRFWYVLAERPDLAQQLLKSTPSRTSPGAGAATAGQAGPSNSSSQHPNGNQQQTQVQQSIDAAASAADEHVTPAHGSSRAAQAGLPPAAAAPNVDVGASAPADGSSLGSPFAVFASSSPNQQLHVADVAAGQAQGATSHSSSPGGTNPAAAAAAAEAKAAGAAPSVRRPCAAQDSIPDIDDLLLQPSTSGVLAPADAGSSAAAALPAAGSTSRGISSAGGISAAWNSAAATAAAKAEAAAEAVLPRAPSPWSSGHNETALDPPITAACGDCAATTDGAGGVYSSSCPVAPSPWDTASPGADATAPAAAGAASISAAAGSGDGAPGQSPAAASGDNTAGSSAEVAAAAAAVAPTPSVSADGEGWEMVSRDVPLVKSAGDLEAVNTVRTLVESMSEEATLDSQRAAKQAIFQAMLEVPWVPGEGIPDSPTDGTKYAELLAAGCASIEEVIVRDVPRTFPEHPLFNTAAGQQKLLRVLKAYAAADPEVGYCQGMAFAAGVLLMYMPEEPAFRLLQRLMSPEGPNLRRYYLPGLEHLKLELSCFELLLSGHQPLLHQHLLDAGLPALLYAAQWLMTTYACPFPIHVAARVLDVLLQSDSDAMLLRLGLAVMEALSSHLLELHDFEELITYLKVKPLSWPLHMHRKVFAAALSSAATDTELAAATAAAREEFVRSGRAASFSSKHLSRQATVGGTLRHELALGPMGPKTLAATEAAAAMAVAAVDGTDADVATTSGGPSSNTGTVGAVDGVIRAAAAAAGVGQGAGQAAGSSSGAAIQQQPQQLSGRLSSTHDAVLVGPAGSGIVVDELDALEDLITDLDLLLPGGASDTDSMSERGSPEPAEQAPSSQHK